MHAGDDFVAPSDFDHINTSFTTIYSPDRKARLNKHHVQETSIDIGTISYYFFLPVIDCY